MRKLGERFVPKEWEEGSTSERDGFKVTYPGMKNENGVMIKGLTYVSIQNLRDFLTWYDASELEVRYQDIDRTLDDGTHERCYVNFWLNGVCIYSGRAFSSRHEAEEYGEAFRDGWRIRKESQ